MEDRPSGHCINKKEDESSLELCSSCEGYTHHRCIERCPLLLLKICRFVCLHYNHMSIFDFNNLSGLLDLITKWKLDKISQLNYCLYYFMPFFQILGNEILKNPCNIFERWSQKKYPQRIFVTAIRKVLANLNKSTNVLN